MRNSLAMLVAVTVVLSLATDAYAWTPTRTPMQVPTATPTPTTPLPPADAFQVRYSSNLSIGDSVVNLTNAGTQGGEHPAGNICANVYAFDASGSMIACCSCPITPNALESLSAKNDLTSNTLTPGVPTSIIVKLLATTPIGTTPSCNASSPTFANLAPGMRAWGTTLHALPTTPVTYGLTETEFSPAVLSASELAELTGDCEFIQTDGQGFGICKSCRLGGL